MTYDVAAHPANDTMPTGQSSLATLTPHACIATNSRSAERRPNPISRAMSRAAGIESANACGSSVVNFSNNPVEVVEWEYPMMIERYGYVPDSGGAGRYRGGMAIERQYRFGIDGGQLQLRGDRIKFRPYGLQGGEPGLAILDGQDALEACVDVAQDGLARAEVGGD